MKAAVNSQDIHISGIGLFNNLPGLGVTLTDKGCKAEAFVHPYGVVAPGAAVQNNVSAAVEFNKSSSAFVTRAVAMPFRW